VRAGRLFALASVATDIDGVPIQIHGIRAMHVPPAATRIELPTFRDAAGMLPDEVYGPMGDAVLDELVERWPCCKAAGGERVVKSAWCAVATTS
jgi:hypothetical protein